MRQLTISGADKSIVFSSAFCSFLSILGLLGGSKSLSVISLVDSLLSKLLINLGAKHFLGDWFWSTSLVDGWKTED